MQHMVRHLVCLATVAGLAFGARSAFALSVGENVIVNGGFETATMQNASRNPDWWNIDGTDAATAATVEGWHKVNSAPRLIKGSNGYVIKSTSFKKGTYCVVIQTSGAIGQTFATDVPGYYTLSYRYMHRDDYNKNLAMYYRVEIDDEVVVPGETLPANDVTVKTKNVAEIYLPAGEHTLVFYGRTDNSEDSSMYLDDVALVYDHSRLVISPIAEQTFDGSHPCRPSVTVTDSRTGGTVDSGDYTVSYSGNGGNGEATVTVTGRGGTDYAGQVGVARFTVSGFDPANDPFGEVSCSVYDLQLVGDRVVYVFTNGTATLTAKTNLVAYEELLVGGGGEGGSTMGGGGGAGALLHATCKFLIRPGESISPTAGLGGSGKTGQSALGASGGDSTLKVGDAVDLTAPGGAGGPSWDKRPANDGGCGAGGVNSSAASASTAAKYGAIGNAGGKAVGNGGGGGGGGVGQAGGVSVANTRAGKGGDGLPFDITGRTVVYGGGGGGGGSNSGYGAAAAGDGGAGGGGAGGKAGPGSRGTDGLGGGGGGGGWTGGTQKGGRGGSGTVIISFKVCSAAELGGFFGEAFAFTPAATRVKVEVEISSPGDGHETADAFVAIVPKGTSTEGHFAKVVSGLTNGTYVCILDGLSSETEYDWAAYVSNGDFDSDVQTGGFTTGAVDFEVADVPTQRYDFEHRCQPEPVVTDLLTGEALEPETHYTFSHAGGSAVGSGSVTVTAVSPLAGTVTKAYSVVTAFDLSIDPIDDQALADGSATPAVVVRDVTSGEIVEPEGLFTVQVSGNTAIGSATVTVSGLAGTIYEGFVTTRTFNVTGAFPRDAYCELEWVASTGSQYVNVGLGGGYGLEMHFGDITSDNDTTYFAAGGWGPNAYLFIRQSSMFKWYGGGSSFGFDAEPNTDYFCQVDLNGTIRVGKEDGSQSKALPGMNISGGSTLSFFGCGNSRFGKFRMYSARLWNASKLVAKFVPAMRLSDGAIGLYDVVRMTFYASSGTGSLTAGPAIANFTVDEIPLQRDDCEEPCRPAVVIRDLGGNEIPQDGFTFNYSGNTQFGTATVVVIAPSGSAYFGAQKRTYEIVSLHGFTATVAASALLVDGEARPVPVVLDRDTGLPLVPEDDYGLTYANNTAPGAATVTVTGRNAYRFTEVTLSFAVLGLIHVAPDGTGDGSTWAQATSLTNALALAKPNGGEIWMKKGVYTMTANCPTFSPQQIAVVRGGFAGTEEALGDRPGDELSTIDGDDRYSPMIVNNSRPVTFERVQFAHSWTHGIEKSGGAGDLTLDGCRITANSTKFAVYSNGSLQFTGVTGRGGYFAGTTASTVTLTNCVIEGNIDGMSVYDSGYGYGAYFKTLKKVVFDDCLFITNGYDRARTADVSNRTTGGAAFYADGVPVVARNCRFVENVSYASGAGGIVYLNGNCSGSIFDHCLWLGNRDTKGTTWDDGGGMGALVVVLGSIDRTVDIVNCTFAYNICGTTKGAAAVSVSSGTANIRNSIFYGNTVLATDQYDNDVQVLGASGKAVVSYSLLDHEPPSAACDHLTVGAAAFVTPLEDFLACINATTPAYPKVNLAGKAMRFRNEKLDDILAFDVHGLSKAGYFRNDGVQYDDATVTSPAVDAGDPESDCTNELKPNGGVVNLGYYGNTPEAALSPVGQPTLTAADVAVEWVGGWSQPRITLTPGISTGDDYAATVEVSVGRDGRTWLESTQFTGVHPGQSRSWVPSLMLDPATDRLYISIVVRSSGATSVELPLEREVGGEIPPWYGKGGDPEKVVHVRPGATGKGDGTSWTDAFTSIADAFASMDATRNELWMAGTEVLLKSTMTFSPSFACTIRGGFTGVENGAAERPAGTVATLDGDCAFQPFTTANTGLMTFERMRFRNAASSCFSKSSSTGSIVFIGCEFRDLVRPSSVAVNTHGVSIVGKSGATATFADCVFSNVLTVAQSGNWTTPGVGAYLETLGRATFDNCSFIRCGRPLGGGFNLVQSTSYGAALGANGTPVTARNCRFVGCSINDSYEQGGTVGLEGNCGGSAFTNCAWIANESYFGGTYGRSYSSGALVVRCDTVNRRVDVQNCTFAYNLSDGAAAPADLNVVKGDVTVGNTIFWGAYTNKYNTVGKAARVRSGSLTISRSLVESAADIGAESAGTLVTNNIVVGDASLVYTYAQFTNNLYTVSGIKRIKTDFATSVLPYLNIHLRGGSGYVDEKTGETVKTWAKRRYDSSAIDAGDPKSPYRNEPKPNGHRVNLGAYGNTQWATMSPGGTVLIVR